MLPHSTKQNYIWLLRQKILVPTRQRFNRSWFTVQKKINNNNKSAKKIQSKPHLVHSAKTVPTTLMEQSMLVHSTTAHSKQLKNKEKLQFIFYYFTHSAPFKWN